MISSFPALREFRPELGDATFDVDLVFLQDVEQTGAAQSFRRRPDENQRVRGPGLFAARIAKSAMKIEQRLAILPNGNRRAEFAKLREIFLEQWRDTFESALESLHHARSVIAEAAFPKRRNFEVRRPGDAASE